MVRVPNFGLQLRLYAHWQLGAALDLPARCTEAMRHPLPQLPVHKLPVRSFYTGRAVGLHEGTELPLERGVWAAPAQAACDAHKRHVDVGVQPRAAHALADAQRVVDVNGEEEVHPAVADAHLT